MDKKIILFTLVLLFALPVSSISAQDSKTGNERDWLLNAEDEQARNILLQKYLRGFDQPMWEVGERYNNVYTALKDENYDLAIYHWKKIKTTIKNGYLKRPARKPNADAIFLNTLHVEVLNAFESRNIKKAWKGFAMGRNACMACHAAENVSWMNDQPLFRDTATPE